MYRRDVRVEATLAYEHYVPLAQSECVNGAWRRGRGGESEEAAQSHPRSPKVTICDGWYSAQGACAKRSAPSIHEVADAGLEQSHSGTVLQRDMLVVLDGYREYINKILYRCVRVYS